MAKSKKWIYGKNVLISGASSGIGFYIAKILSSKYACKVVGLGRNVTKLENSKILIDNEINGLVKKRKNATQMGEYVIKSCDVSTFEAWQGLKNELDKERFKVDVLINNAGIMSAFDKFENQSLETAKQIFETNFFAHLYSYKTFINDIKSSKGGIINISSSSALCSVAGAAVYGASKAASKTFAETIGLEHKKDFYVAYVCPGFTDTDLFREEKELSKLVKSISTSAEKMAKKIVRKIVKKQRRIVLGTDAHLMSGFNRIAPSFASKIISGVLRISKDKMFDNVFPENKDKRKQK